MSTVATSETEVRSAPLRVLVVDDHETMRTILRKSLSRQLIVAVELVGEAENGSAALEAAARFLPEVVVMDVEMPCLDGVEATRQIVQRFPTMQVVGWTMCDEPIAEKMLEAGAAFVVRKDEGLVSLFEALLRVAIRTGRTQSEPGSESA